VKKEVDVTSATNYTTKEEKEENKKLKIMLS